MDFIPKKPALEVDKIRESGRATGCHSSRPGGEGTSGESTIKDADGEVPFSITASEEEEPALMHAVVEEELRPPIAEVAYPCNIPGFYQILDFFKKIIILFVLPEKSQGFKTF
jgi:hypothetical protein